MKIITLVTTAFLAVMSTAGFIAVLSIVGLLTALSAAGAADLPRKEPPPPVAAAPIGKYPVGKYPVGKYPVGKYPQPVVTKGRQAREVLRFVCGVPTREIARRMGMAAS